MLRILAGTACALSALVAAPVAQAHVSMEQVRGLADSHRQYERMLAGCMLNPATPDATRTRANADRLHAGRRRQAIIRRRVIPGRLAYARVGFVRSRARLIGDLRRCRVQGALDMPSAGTRSGVQPLSAGGGAAESPMAAKIVAAAETRLGSPYVYASAGPDSFDCSGFTWWTLNEAGLGDYQRSSTYIEWRTGIGEGWERGTDASQLRVGDIVYSRPSSQGPGHAGLYVGGGEMIHASSGGGRVMRSDITSGYYAERFVGWLRHPGLTTSG